MRDLSLLRIFAPWKKAVCRLSLWRGCSSVLNIRNFMYTVIKRMEVSAAHSLSLSYPSKCGQLHGHNWIITVYCRARELNADGMVVDFSHIKQLVKGRLDHRNLNETLPFNPTAENIARWICEQIPACFRVEVQESESNMAVYEKD